MIDSRATALDKMLDLHRNLLEGTTHIEIFRAVSGTYLKHLKGLTLSIHQTFKPDAEPFLQGKFKVNAEPEALPDVCIVFATKHREETLSQIATAVQRLHEGGLLIVTAANELGAPSLERRCDELLGKISSYSKQKCRVFWGRKDSQSLNADALTEWLDYERYRAVEDSGLVACPGLFSAKSIDPGSRLLAEHLPTTLKGCGADYGAGYGFLSHSVLTRCPVIQEWHLFEAESKALLAARHNLAGMATQVDIHYHWCDIAGGPPPTGEKPQRFDCIVMNPPFHTGRDARPELGKAFIRTAAMSLKPGGVLYLVANRQLPYEETLSQQGFKSECLATAQGYKIIAARH